MFWLSAGVELYESEGPLGSLIFGVSELGRLVFDGLAEFWCSCWLVCSGDILRSIPLNASFKGHLLSKILRTLYSWGTSSGIGTMGNLLSEISSTTEA